MVSQKSIPDTIRGAKKIRGSPLRNVHYRGTHLASRPFCHHNPESPSMLQSMTPPELQPLVSSRILLRRLEESDLDALYAFMGDIEVMYAWEYTFTREDVFSWIERMRSFPNPELGYRALCLKGQEDRIIGQAGILPKTIFGKECLEIGYILDRRFWHRGYATEAGALLFDHAFDSLGAGEMYATIRPMNTSSLAVARRLGMQPIGEIVIHHRGQDMPHTVLHTDKMSWKAWRTQFLPLLEGKGTSHASSETAL